MSFVLIFIANSLFAQTFDRHIEWKYTTKKINDSISELHFTAKMDKGFHLYSQYTEASLPTKFTFEPSTSYKLIDKTKEPKPHTYFDSLFMAIQKEFTTSQVEFIQQVKVLDKNNFAVKGKIDGQVCNDQGCIDFKPPFKFSFDVEGNKLASITAEIKEDKVGAVVNTTVKPNAEVAVKKDSSKTELNASTATTAAASGDCNPWEKLILGLIAGLGAMLMPCIYSLIPLTVSFFLKRSKSRSQGIRDSLLYGFFIVISFVIPTMLLVVAFGPEVLGNISSNTYLNLFFFILFVVFALSFFGMFEITLPSSWGNKLDAKADKGGVIGIFFMALTLVVVSFSCTAGFLGPLLTALAEGSSYMCPLFGFTGFGLGIALPFMIFAFFPNMLKSLPKSGGWMDTFKVTIAFIELALAVKFLANADNKNEWGFLTREVFISLWIAIFGMLSLYLLGVFRTTKEQPNNGLSVGRILTATIFVGFTMYLIPGLWGAPLKLISSFPPPHYYSESPDGFHQQVVSVDAKVSEGTSNGSPREKQLADMRISGPDGLRIFKDLYEEALEYSKLVKKPLFVDFTGTNCQNCREMESSVWPKPEVLSYLRDSVVIVSLYTDSPKELAKEQQKEVIWNGEKTTLETIGDRWGYIRTEKYKSVALPLYVVLNEKEETISNGTMPVERDPKVYSKWISDAVRKYKSSNP